MTTRMTMTMTMTMTLRTTLAALAAFAVLLTFGTSLQAQAQAPAAVTPVTDAVLQEPDPGDWLNWRRTLDGWGYSPLDEVDREGNAQLHFHTTNYTTKRPTAHALISPRSRNET